MKFSKFKIVDICNQIVSGGTPLTKITEYYGGNICWLKTKEVNFNRIYDTEFKITELGLENSSAKIIPKNSIIIAMYGNGDTAGRCAINKIPLATNQACCNLTIDESKADYVYIYYLIKSKYEELVNLKNGGAQQNLSLQLIKEIEILLPELDTQKKIGNVLSSYDDLIENNLKRINLLEETAELIYKEWFVNFRFPGYEKCEFVDGIPSGWLKKIFNEVCNVRNGYAFKSNDYSNEGVRIIRTRDFSESVFIDIKEDIRISNNILEQYEKYLLSEYEFLLIMVGASIGKYGIVLKKDLPSLQNQNMWAIYSKDSKEIPQTYVIEFMKEFVNTLMAYRTGAARDFFRKSHLEERKILIPEPKVLLHFDKMVKPIYVQINTLLYENEKLKEARDILIPKLIMGEIEV